LFHSIVHFLLLTSLLLSFTLILVPSSSFLLFFLYAPAPTEIYTLSLHDALPIFFFKPKCLAMPLAILRPACLNTLLLRYFLISIDRKSTRLNSSHVSISYADFCLKKKNNITRST